MKYLINILKDVPVVISIVLGNTEYARNVLLIINFILGFGLIILFIASIIEIILGVVKKSRDKIVTGVLIFCFGYIILGYSVGLHILLTDAWEQIIYGHLFFLKAIIILIFTITIIKIIFLLDCYRNSSLPQYKKIMWLLAMLFFGLIGILIYYFIIKRNNNIKKS